MCKTLAYFVIFIVSLIFASEDEDKFEVDDNGYIFFCLCMGRFGNQAEHFLGGLAFAKSINRTLVVPPFRTYKNMEYDEWFLERPLHDYHKVILAKDFMKHVAPTVWPPDKRYGFCFSFPDKEPCDMVTGNPHGKFWTDLDVTFVDTVQYSTHYNDIQRWKAQFPGSKYPVIAMKGAPASFPMNPAHINLQKYIHFSENLMKEAEGLLERDFGSTSRDYVSVHLRHGSDWEKACERVGHDVVQPNYTPKFMSSYQCQGTDYKIPLTKEMCLPSKEIVFDQVKKVMQEEGVNKLLVATDKISWVEQFREILGPAVQVIHPDPHNPLVDIVLLSEAQHFIGNCVSSFTAFVWRQREMHKKGKTSHFAHSPS